MAARARFLPICALSLSLLGGGCGGAGEAAGANASAPEAGMFDARADELEEKANVMIAAAARAVDNAAPPSDNGSDPAAEGGD